MRMGWTSLALSLSALPVLATAAGATLGGLVLDERGHPVVGAKVSLRNPVSSYRLVAMSDAKGHYTLPNIPFHEYHLEVVAPGFVGLHEDLELRSAVPLRKDLVLKPTGAVVEVVDSANLVEGHPSAHTEIDRTTIELSPAPVQSRAMDSILLSTPGFVADENGRFHFKGSHGQVMYVVDGVPITDQMQATFSNSLDPGQAEGIEVVTGGVSAEFGGKPVAVVNITTKTGLGTPGGFAGDVSAGAARFNTFEAGFGLRGGTDVFGYSATAAASQSDRFLDPVSFDNLHNHGTTGRAFLRLDWLLSSEDTLRLSIFGGDTKRDVVNLPSEQFAGQDQRARTTDANLNVAWNHLLDSTSSLEVSVFGRYAQAQLTPTGDLEEGFVAGGSDSPYWAWQDRSLMNLGGQATYSKRFEGGSNLKAGIQYVQYPIHERFRFAVTQDGLYESTDPLYAYTPAGGGHIWSFEDRITPRMASAFMQDDLHLSTLILGLGLRYDTYSVKDITQAQFQPRLGAAWHVTSSTVLRASYDRLMIIRENENLALSLSQQAWDLGPYAGTKVPELRPELQDSLSYGVEQQVGQSWRFVAEYWLKRSRNAADTGQFLNTGVVFPVGMSHGDFHGWNLRAELAPVNGFSGYLSLGRTRARVEAPVVGGLQLDPPEAAPGTWFLIDHDQKYSGQLGVNWEGSALRLGAVCRYDSGLVAGDPAGAGSDYAFGLPYVTQDSEGTWRTKSRTVWNFTSGYSLPLAGKRKVDVGFDLMNAFNKQALFDFMSECGGTHVIPPRTWAAHVKYQF